MNTEGQRLTVVTIGRNDMDGLAATRTSVAAQSYAHLDHLIIDGASTDGTVEYLRSLTDAPGVIWLSEPDRGIYDAMNKAFEHVSDGYMLYLNAGDTFVDGDSVTRGMEAIQQADFTPTVAIGWSRFVDRHGEPLPYVVGGATPNAITSAQESTFFLCDFHRHERYNDARRSAADYELFRRLARRADLRVLRINSTIANFAFGGRSNDPAFDKARFEERAEIDAGFGEEVTTMVRLRATARRMTRRVVYSTVGADRAARLFLWLACRRGNSGARRQPVGQVRVEVDSPG